MKYTNNKLKGNWTSMLILKEKIYKKDLKPLEEFYITFAIDLKTKISSTYLALKFIWK